MGYKRIPKIQDKQKKNQGLEDAILSIIRNINAKNLKYFSYSPGVEDLSESSSWGYTDSRIFYHRGKTQFEIRGSLYPLIVVKRPRSDYRFSIHYSVIDKLGKKLNPIPKLHIPRKTPYF